MLYLWWRMDEEGRVLRVWSLYGRFCGLMVCGSCFGAVAWAAKMMTLVNGFKGNTSEDPAEEASLFVLAYSWRAAFSVTYAVEFLCLSAAKLMVLDRMSVFAAPQGARLQTRWAAAGRVVMACCSAGQCCRAGGQRCSCSALSQGCRSSSRRVCVLRRQQHSSRQGYVFTWPARGATRRLHLIRAVVLRGCRAAPHCRRVCCSWSAERAPRQPCASRS